MSVVTNVHGFHIPGLCCRCGCPTCRASNHESYNGWVNRETWAASLHLDNTQWVQVEARAVVTAAVLEARTTTESLGLEPTDGMVRAGERLAVWVDELIADQYGASGVSEMRDEIGSRWRVDWASVARALVEEA
jgi:hypothetical protein